MSAGNQSAQYDLLISGGEVIDPGSGLSGQLDVAVSAGKIADVLSNINDANLKAAVRDEVLEFSHRFMVP